MPTAHVELAEASDKAKVLHAEWALRFAALRKSDNPVTVELTPALARTIAVELRRWMLEVDDNMRGFPEGPEGLLAMERRRRMEAAGGAVQSLTIDRPVATVAHADGVPQDPLAGLSEQQLGAVARFNARAEGGAAVDMAAQNLRAVHPFAVIAAKNLGLYVDWASQEGRACLMTCLKAFRTASAEVCQRDVGEVIETPPSPEAQTVFEAEPEAATTTKRMADAFAAWEGLGTRKDETVRVFRLHVAVFAELMGDPDLATLRRADGVRFRDALTRRAIKDGNMAASADNVLTTIKAMTNVALDQEWLTVNPSERLPDIAISDHRQRDDAGCSLRAVHGIAAHEGSPLVADGLGSVEDVAQPGLIAVALLAPAMLGVCELPLRLH